MVFVNWGLLWLLPLAAIPILLHLLTLHRLRTVELSTFRFLFDSYMQQRRRMQFLEALLAILRTLFLLLLVLVFARPVVRHWNDLFRCGSGGREVILLMDCSASMNAQTAGVSAFDRAKSAARGGRQTLAAGRPAHPHPRRRQPEEVFSRFTTDAERHRGEDRRPDHHVVAGQLLRRLHAPVRPRGARSAPTRSSTCSPTARPAAGARSRNQGLDRILPPETPFVVVNVGSNEAIAQPGGRRRRAAAAPGRRRPAGPPAPPASSTTRRGAGRGHPERLHRREGGRPRTRCPQARRDGRDAASSTRPPSRACTAAASRSPATAPTASPTTTATCSP